MRRERKEVKEALEIILEVVKYGHLLKGGWDKVAEHTRLTPIELTALKDAVGSEETVMALKAETARLRFPSKAEEDYKASVKRREAELIAALPKIKKALKAKGLRLRSDSWTDAKADKPVSARVYKPKPKNYFQHDKMPYAEITIFGKDGSPLGLEVLRDYQLLREPTMNELAYNEGVAQFTIGGLKLPQS